ncbi:MAG TPA: adenosylmethionine decarboxylase [Ktedonobacterales bacterium]|nr:adenosylmethionine decarboxylase [Ktedonobacterales bacterium]
MFGPHLIIDGSRCNTQKLADRILVEQVLNDYPAAIGMTKIGGPYMFEYQAPDPAYSGVSGLVVIAESHIAIHTFPELDYFTMDIFSCKNFDHEKAIAYIKEAFDVQEMDRMLVQRGLSFKGPHHGANGATDELIAAAEARLAAGIISKEPALPDAPTSVADGRDAALARRGGETQGEGRMIWPQYGVTPDVGTYGASVDAASDDDCDSCARGGATVAPLGHAGETVILPDGRTLTATEPPLVNPTASISGLLDKLTAGAGQGRAMGRALSEWERLARAKDMTIALTLAEPVIAAGLRETLVYAVEHRYMDVIIASADDLFADIYEALGAAHYADAAGVTANDAGRTRALAFVSDFLSGVDAATIQSSAALWKALGESLPSKAPRKGLLQAAATFGVTIITPDLGASAIGAALAAARARGAGVAVDASLDLVELAQILGARPNLGVIRVGTGLEDGLLLQARDAAEALGAQRPSIIGSVTIGASALGQGVSVATDASLAAPLLVTGLAQRIPGVRHVAQPDSARQAEPALA